VKALWRSSAVTCIATKGAIAHSCFGKVEKHFGVHVGQLSREGEQEGEESVLNIERWIRWL